MDKWQDPRTPVSVTQVGKYTVTIYDQEKYDESLRMYGDDAPTDRIKDAKDKKPLVQNFAQGVIPNNKSNASKPSFAKQKPAARWNWTHKLDQPLNCADVGTIAKDAKADLKYSDVAGIRDQDLVRNFVEAREKEGHLFFWNDAAGFLQNIEHLTNSWYSCIAC